MKRLGLVLLAFVMVGIAGCGGGGGSSDSGEFDPTGSVWQFLVATADAGDTMYTLSFFDSTGAKAASGVFTAVSAGGASYSGSWTSSDNVVTGASSGNFVFTLNVNDDTSTGTIDYVTPEGSGSAAATRTDMTTATMAGTYVFSSAMVNGTPEAISGSVTLTSSGTHSGSVTTEEGTEPISGTFTVDGQNITFADVDGSIDTGVITDDGRTITVSQINDEGTTTVLVLTRQ